MPAIARPTIVSAAMRAMLCCLLMLGAGAACAEGRAAAEPLVVYSVRTPPLIQPILERYTRERGVPVTWLSDAAPALIERLATEGSATPADLFLAVDAGSLWQAAERGLLAPLHSPALEAAVPAAWRDPGGRWFALSQRQRVIAHSAARVQPAQLSTYEALSDPEWSGRLCLGSSRQTADQSLVAALVARSGAEQIESVVQGWVRNLAAPPFADDARVLQAIATGQCDVGLVDTRALVRRQQQDPALPVAVFWPNQADAGVHVDITGAGVVAQSAQREAAQELLEWLASAAAQEEFARLDLEQPVAPGIGAGPAAASRDAHRADPGNVAEAGRRRAEALQLMDRAGWK
jgi:iron(III) transport system substrate-binding protein